jgi:hypothetical protein
MIPNVCKDWGLKFFNSILKFEWVFE